MGHSGMVRAVSALLVAAAAAVLLPLVFLRVSALGPGAVSDGTLYAGGRRFAACRSPLRSADWSRRRLTAPTRRRRPHIQCLSRVPTGTWKPLGPAPIGPPYAGGGGFYGGTNSGRITAITTIPSGAAGGPPRGRDGGWRYLDFGQRRRVLGSAIRHPA